MLFVNRFELLKISFLCLMLCLKSMLFLGGKLIGDGGEGSEDHSLIVGKHMRIGVKGLLDAFVPKVAADCHDRHTFVDQK